MGTFSTKKTIKASPYMIEGMAKQIEESFTAEGFDVKSINLLDGGFNISITKGNMFKAVLGMKTALNVSLTPKQDNIFFDAGVGIYGQQAIPTIISMFFFWPVLITQIWGMVEQAKLDDKALEIVEKYVAEHFDEEPKPYKQSSSNKFKRFCTNCGQEMTNGEICCPKCGSKQIS